MLSIKPIAYSAPGSLILTGEHAVLAGELATACAINQRVTTSLLPRSDRKIHIQSQLGELKTSLDRFEIQQPFQFVLAAIARYKAQLNVGFDLIIDSQFSATVGFASSAAVSVATLACLWQLSKQIPINKQKLFEQAHQVILAVQGRGSGADVAAAVFGGTIAYRYVNKPGLSRTQKTYQTYSIEKLAHNPSITAVYSGRKTPTPQVIAAVQQRFADNPEQLQTIYRQIGQCSEQARHAINQADWPVLARVLTANHQLMQQLGVSNHKLEQIVNDMTQQPNIIAAKISGSGLGDCVIGLGELDSWAEPENWFKLSIASEGVTHVAK